MERLSQLCELHLQANLSLDNLWDVLSLAHTQKVERAKQLCMEFAYTHHDAVLSDPRFRKLEVDLIVDESQLYSKYRAQLEGGWRPPVVEVTAPSTMVEDFKALYDSMTGADHVVVVEKQQIKCHKAILGHASPTLMELADAKDGSPLPKEYKSVSANTFSALLRYLYYGNTDIEPMAATQLISFAKQLTLTTLVDICEAKIRHGIDNGTCLSILEVAYHPILKDRDELQKELKTNCRSYFIDHIREIDVAPLKSMDAAIGADLLLSVQKQIGVSWTIGGDASASSAPNGNMTPSSSGTHVANTHRKKASRMSSSYDAKKTASGGAMSEEEHSASATETASVPVASGSIVGHAVAASATDASSNDSDDEKTATPAAAAVVAAHDDKDAHSASEHSAAAPATPSPAPAAVADKEHDKSGSAEADTPHAAEATTDAEPASPPHSPKVSRSESKREKKDKVKDKKAEKEEKDEKEDSGSKKDEAPKKDEKEEGKKDKKDKSKDKKEKEKSKDKKKKE